MEVPGSLLFQSPLDRLSDAILQADQGGVTESPFCLVNAVVSCHAGIRVPLACERGRLSDQPANGFAEKANNDAHVLGDDPDMLLAVRAARGVPDEAAEVPKVDGGVIGDEEGLAIDALVVQGHGCGGGGEQEGAGGQQVGVSDVLDVGEVEQVVVVTQLPTRLARAVDIDEVVLRHEVALADDARGPDGGR